MYMIVVVLLCAYTCITQHQHGYTPQTVQYSLITLPLFFSTACIYSMLLHCDGLTSPFIITVLAHVLVRNVLIHPSANTILKASFERVSWFAVARTVITATYKHYCYIQGNRIYSCSPPLVEIHN